MTEKSSREFHLAGMLRLKVARLQLNGHQAAQETMVASNKRNV
jgi:hypothetical protein